MNVQPQLPAPPCPPTHTRRYPQARLALLTACLLSAATAPAAAAATADALSERIVVPLSQPGRPAHVEVGLLHGGITVEAWDGKEVVVHAVARHGDERERHREKRDAPPAAGMRRIPSQSLGLAIEEEANTVEIGSESWNQAIDLRIQVPADSTLALSCVNDGDIVVSGVRGEMELSNTNGRIEVRGAAAPVVAETVNGDLVIVFERLGVQRPLAFSTLNGDIDITLPAATKADLALRTDHGEIYSDFEIEMVDNPTRRRESREGGRTRIEIEKLVRGRLNGGGPELSLKTFHGDIVLRRGR
jgi:hypothetical protein